MVRLFTGTLLLSLLALTLMGCDKDEANRLVDPPNPEMLISPASLDFSSDRSSDTLFVTNTGDGTLQWSLNADSYWIFLDPDTGRVAEAETDTVLVSITRNGLTMGSYSDTIRAMDNDLEQAVVGVHMDVPLPDAYTLVEYTEATLHEDQEFHHGPYTLLYDTVPSFEMSLIDWPGDYELELLILEPAEYNKYAAREPFEAVWAETIAATGITQAIGDTFIPNGTQIYIVIDNTDGGFVETDFDEYVDTAVFDFTLTMTPQE